MTKPKVEYFKHSTRLQVRIDMPDGKTYGIEVPADHPHESVIEMVNEIIDNPRSRRLIDEKGGLNLITGGPQKKVRIYRERSKC
jgi:hypothetical protein